MRKSRQEISSSDKKSSENNSQPTLFKLAEVEKKKVEVQFSLEKTSSDGGLLLLKEIENQTGIISRLSGCIQDTRHQSYVQHEIKTMLSQRIMQIAAGYEDANDCNDLRDDGVIKVCCGTTQELASQPTMSRFENLPRWSELYKMAVTFVDQFIASYPKEPEIIILDCDDTAALVYGQQQLSLFNTYYGDSCYMPLHIYEGLTGKLILTLLKPGRRSKSVNVFAILRRLIIYLRKKWSKTIIILRGDSHFCSKEFMDWSVNQKNVEFITGLTGNSVLDKYSDTTIESAKREYAATGKPVKRYHSFEYRANSWEHLQRVVVKVEMNSMGLNVRYITSSIRFIRARELYENGYCARGSAELRIKDHKTYLHSDRMSCENFSANQVRLFMHSAAYVLIHTLQNEVLKGTQFCKATMRTIQLKIIKIAAQVKILKTKIQIELPKDYAQRLLLEKCFGMFELLRI
jgi:hypothetical protein